MTRELRDHIASWPTWQRDMWLASIVFCVVGPGWIVLPPAVRLWLVGCIVVAVVVGLVGAWAEERRGRLAAEAESERLERELVARGPRLRVVPNVSDDEWFGRLYDENGGHRA